MADLFSTRADEVRARHAPLAARMRPRTLDEVAGQPGLLAAGAAFRRLVEGGRPVSMILWGPPGTGKTTLARLVAAGADAVFETLSATAAGVKEVREVLAAARHRLETDERRTVLFLDEIHRFSKNQQDALLPGVEDGTLVLVGATTENPFFEVNSPLMSRMTLFRTESLTPSELESLLDRALDEPERGLGAEGLTILPEARAEIARRTGGDARQALNALEVAATLTLARGAEAIEVADVEEALQRRIIRYDKTGDQHYDVISAFIKSVRGSDPDAALYWLHLMLEAGEDPEFIARRLVILASEDVGLADRWALPVAVAGAQALAYVGLPEAAYHLSHVTLFLALAPKSDSVGAAMASARQLVREGALGVVPAHLRSSPSGRDDSGDRSGYRSAHEGEGHVVRQQYFPDGVEARPLYSPGAQGFEPELARRLEWIDGVLGRAGR